MNATTIPAALASACVLAAEQVDASTLRLTWAPGVDAAKLDWSDEMVAASLGLLGLSAETHEVYTDDLAGQVETIKARSTIRFAIDDGPVTPDADGGHRGWDASIILNPEDRSVSLYTCIGSGVPAYCYHRRAIMLHVDKAASGESVTGILKANADLIEEIFARYEGTHWNGSNNVGVWDEGEGGELDDLTTRLTDKLAEAQTYWDASSWLGGAWSECKREVADAMAAGRDLDELAAEWVTQGASDGVLVDQDAVREQIARMVDQIEDADGEI